MIAFTKTLSKNESVLNNSTRISISYQAKLNSIGFGIQAFQDDPTYKTQGIFIKKLEMTQ